MVQRESKPEIATTFATNASKPTQFQAGRPTRNHYGKTGHEVPNYFELVGYLVGRVILGGGRSHGRGRGGRGGFGIAGRGRGVGAANTVQVGTKE